MAAGLPDWTTGVDILAQTIGNLVVDIAAQSIGNLAVNIAASAITIDINLKTSDITLNIDITAQTVGDITISVDAQNVGVHTEAEWETVQGTNKDIEASQASVASGSQLGKSYQVSLGKKFYLTHFGLVLAGSTDVRFHFEGYIENNSTGAKFFRFGGEGGMTQSLHRPLLVPQNQYVRMVVTNQSTITCDIGLSFGGYEI